MTFFWFVLISQGRKNTEIGENYFNSYLTTCFNVMVNDWIPSDRKQRFWEFK